MRRVAARLPVLCLFAALAAACTTSRADGSSKIETTSEAKQADVEGAVSAPLRDVNLLRTKIPPVLLAAMADAYEVPPGNARLGRTAACAQIAALLAPLDDALGLDLDARRQENNLRQKSRHAVLGAVADVTSESIPFRGWVRKLTGAERHDRLVEEAIVGGSVRRAYLKGVGEARGCEPPAAPEHEFAGALIPTQAIAPRYPIR